MTVRKENPAQADHQAAIARSAVISEDGVYRYRLDRCWGGGGRVVFVLLNPSTADGDSDDPTLRRCMAYARSYGAGSLTVVNVFAYRATNPSKLLKVIDPVGPEADNYITQAAKDAELVIAGWGATGRLYPLRVSRVLDIIQGPIHALSITKGGHPGHPLYLKSELKPALWRGREGAGT